MSLRESPPVVADRAHPAVRIRNGVVRGIRRGPISMFKGIPYARPPVDELRFRSPRPPEDWDGVLDAAAFGPIAPQPPARIGGRQPARQSEDSLSINVYTPDGGATGLPVMVWIHGGAYYLGSSADPLYEGSALATMGVVVVTFNYRIGALGYLDFSSFSTADEVFESNLGHRDQIMALEWVRSNIAEFGGDPNRVTVFGESSGAGAVTALLATPSAHGLFHGAIAQSPPAGVVYTPERARGFAERFLAEVGIDRDDVARLRTADIDALSAASARLVRDNGVSEPGTFPLSPVVDGDLIPEYPLDAFEAGRAARVPLVIGYNNDEAGLFWMMRSSVLPTTVAGVKLMVDHIGTPEAAALPEAYAGFPSTRAALRLSSDAAFRMPSTWAATAHSRFAPTWVYQFDFAQPVMRLTGLGAVHGAELAHVWASGVRPPIPLGGKRAALRLTARMQARWVRFAQALEPNAPDIEPIWPLYDEVDRRVMVFDSSDRIVSDPGGDVRRAWGDKAISFR